MNWGTNPELHPELNLTMYHRNVNETLKQQALQALVRTKRHSLAGWVRQMAAALFPSTQPKVRRQCVHVCVQQ